MTIALEDKATQAGFARLVGVTKQSISVRFSDGLLPRGGTYSAWLKIYLDHLRQEAAGRSEKELSAIRGRKELAQAMREELELAKDMKLIVLSDSVAPAIIGILKEVQTHIMQAAKRALMDIQSEHQVPIDDDKLLEPLRSAFRNVAGSGDKLIASINDKPCSAVSTALASDSGMDTAEHKAAIGE